METTETQRRAATEPVPQVSKTRIPEILRRFESEILNEWIVEQEKSVSQTIQRSELLQQCSDFLRQFMVATQTSTFSDIKSPAWEGVRKILDSISRARGLQGFMPSETAMFVFSLKQPLFSRLRHDLEAQPQTLVSEIMMLTAVLDQLGLYTTEVYQSAREEVIRRQQEEMLELSTPVVKLWEGVLALPLIGTLDSSRTQVVMESLLQRIVETNSEIAIIDITGVPTVDTLVAQHLIRTVTAARLMGAECIISGIRPQIAATIVHLGVDLSGIATKASLADAFSIALNRLGRTISRAPVRTEARI